MAGLLRPTGYGAAKKAPGDDETNAPTVLCPDGALPDLAELLARERGWTTAAAAAPRNYAMVLQWGATLDWSTVGAPTFVNHVRGHECLGIKSMLATTLAGGAADLYWPRCYPCFTAGLVSAALREHCALVAIGACRAVAERPWLRPATQADAVHAAAWAPEALELWAGCSVCGAPPEKHHMHGLWLEKHMHRSCSTPSKPGETSTFALQCPRRGLVGIGQVRLRPVDAAFPDGEVYGHVCRITVSPRYRRQGLGRALVTALLQAASDFGRPLTAFSLFCEPENTAARELYLSMGFVSHEPFAGTKVVMRAPLNTLGRLCPFEDDDDDDDSERRLAERLVALVERRGAGAAAAVEIGDADWEAVFDGRDAQPGAPGSDAKALRARLRPLDRDGRGLGARAAAALAACAATDPQHGAMGAAEAPAWIVKPAGGACGEGISVTDSVGGLLAAVARLNFEAVAQRYVERPLLVGGHKSDLRVWVLVTSCAPLVVWGFSGAYARFAGGRYSLADLRDRRAHLTNRSVQGRADDPWDRGDADPLEAGLGGSAFLDGVDGAVAADDGAVPPDDSDDSDDCDDPADAALREGLPRPRGVWSDADLAAYVQRRRGDRDGHFWRDTVWPAIGRLAVATISASAHKLSRTGRGFEWLGVDVMLDSACTPWLLEVNTSPHLSGVGHPVSAGYCRAAVADLAAMMLDERLLDGTGPLDPARGLRAARLNRGVCDPPFAGTLLGEGDGQGDDGGGAPRWELWHAAPAAPPPPPPAAVPLAGAAKAALARLLAPHAPSLAGAAAAAAASSEEL